MRPAPGIPRQIVAPIPRNSPPEVARAARARSIVKTFEAGIPGCSARVRALNGAELDVRPGEVVGVIGEAGAGKSTLLLTLAGMLRPDAGTLIWYADTGRPVKDLSAVEYIPAWRASHALQSLKRALAEPPGFLLLDDTLTALDAASRREAKVLIRELRAARVTMVLAAREGTTCSSLCSRMLRLRAGKIDSGRPIRL